MKGFRYKRSIPVAYDRQGFIYFLTRRYAELTASERKLIRRIAEKAAGEHKDALMAYITTGAEGIEVCTKHFLSESTLERCVRRFYIAFDKCM